MKTTSAAVLALGLFATASVAALEAGVLRLQRPAGQTPYAEIALTDSASIDPASVRARLATPEGYRVAGMRYLPSLRSISLTPQATADGRVVLRVDGLPSSSEVDELDLLLLVGDRVSLDLKEYRVDLRGAGRDFAPTMAGTRLAATKPGSSPPASARAPAATAATLGSAAVQSAQPAAQGAEPDERLRSQVEQALAAWTKAWSERNVDAYLSSYVADYRPPTGRLSHAEWQRQRRQRIGSKQSIEVAISAVQLRERGDAVIATFQQRYRGDELSENSRKRLVLVRQQDRWLIQEEAELR